MNIETQDGVVHAGYKTDQGGCFIRLVCDEVRRGRWYSNFTVTDRPLNCAACRRRLEKKRETTG